MTDPDRERARAFEAVSPDPGHLESFDLSGLPDMASAADSRTAGAAASVSSHRIPSVLAPELRRLLQRLANLGDGVAGTESIARSLGGLLVPALADLCVVELRYADGSRQIATTRPGAFPSAAALLSENAARIVVEGLSVADGDGQSSRPRLHHSTDAACLRFAVGSESTTSEVVRTPFGSAIFAPLAIGNDLVGTFSLFRAADQPRFVESDVDLVEIAAALGTVAIQRAAATVVVTPQPGSIARTFSGADKEDSHPDTAGSPAASVNAGDAHGEMERMAQIGTIYSGLGHDLGNLLLPLRLRLDSLRRLALPPEGEADLAAIETAVSYLQQLATGLRWLATGRNAARDAVTSTRLRGWAADVQAILRDALPAGASLTIEIPPRLPAVCMSRPALTQAVFNLVQNAGHALRGRPDGHVVVGARRDRDQEIVRIFVRDNGPGLSDEAKRRCFEPFYSSKKRGISTGLGLAIVRALARSAGGDVSVVSEVGAGATFTMAVPLAGRTHASAVADDVSGLRTAPLGQTAPPVAGVSR